MAATPIFKEPKDHTVYRNDEEMVVPSVTTILKIINKEELLYWANSLGYKRISVRSELESHAYIGSCAHYAIDEYFKTGRIDLDSIIDERRITENICVKNAFISFSKYFIENRKDFEIIENEKSISGKKFGGTLDLLAKYKKNKLILCDFKTSKDFYISMFLQLAAYDLLLKETEKMKIDGYMVILLDKKNGNKAKIKLIDDKEEMKFYRECFKKLVDFYYDYYYINQKYWGKELSS